MNNLPNSFESKESIIDRKIEELAEREGMDAGDILSDLATLAPYEGSEHSNPDYIEETAEMIGVSVEDLTEYAISKAKSIFGWG